CRQPRPRPHLRFKAFRKSDGKRSRHHRVLARREHRRRALRNGREQIEASGVRALGSRQRQAFAGGELADVDFASGAHSIVSTGLTTLFATCAISSTATCSFVITGQESTSISLP